MFLWSLILGIGEVRFLVWFHDETNIHNLISNLKALNASSSFHEHGITAKFSDSDFLYWKAPASRAMSGFSGAANEKNLHFQEWLVTLASDIKTNENR